MKSTFSCYAHIETVAALKAKALASGISQGDLLHLLVTKGLSVISDEDIRQFVEARSEPAKRPPPTATERACLTALDVLARSGVLWFTPQEIAHKAGLGLAKALHALYSLHKKEIVMHDNGHFKLP